MGLTNSREQYTLLPPPPYEKMRQITTVIYDDNHINHTTNNNNIKYRIFYRYLNGLRLTFSGPAIYESYDECLSACTNLNEPRLRPFTDMSSATHLYHFPG